MKKYLTRNIALHRGCFSFSLFVKIKKQFFFYKKVLFCKKKRVFFLFLGF